VSITTTSVEATRAFGRALAAHLRPGDVIVLTGDLGAGKTACSQGIAAGLGVTERVTSPTFTIVQEYEGDVPVQHLDLYRLGSVQEVLDLGLDETIDDRVTLVEWGDVALAALPEEHLELVITLVPDAGDDVRTITATGRGARWAGFAVDALAPGSP
jgi:tRNA threonylcarbamoyladenosine biosynthesis protein TsaE